jgi:hypothetical protein
MTLLPVATPAPWLNGVLSSGFHFFQQAPDLKRYHRCEGMLPPEFGNNLLIANQLCWPFTPVRLAYGDFSSPPRMER